MLRRLGPVAMTIGSLLCAASASAQTLPAYTDGAATVPARSASLIDAPPTSHATPPAGPIVGNPATFNPYSVHDELRSRHNQGPLWENPSGKVSDYYRCNDCVNGNCSKHYGGKLKSLFHSLGEDEPKDPGPDFQCANCWSTFNFEHKTFASYHYLGPLRTATKVGYGRAHGATVGTEWLPWVYRDDERHFSRWGFLTAFDYNYYQGNEATILQSEQSGNVLSSDGGNGFGALLGPVFRSDLYLFGCVRMSPTVSFGLDLNWVTMKEELPTVVPPAPVVRPDPQPTFTSAEGAFIRSIETFKYTDFCIGGYFRVVFDFPITQKINVGWGMDARMSKTDAFVRRDDWRKHFGMILQVTGEF